MSQIKDVLNNRKYMKYVIFLAFTAAILYILYFVISNFSVIFQSGMSLISAILSALSPLFIGLFLAYLLNPLVNLINTNLLSRFFHKVSEGKLRFIGILITYLVIILLIIVILYAFSFLILGKFIFSGFGDIYDTVINYISNYESSISSWASNLEISGLSETLNNIADTIINWISTNFSTASILEVIASIGGSIINILLGIIVSIYLLKDQIFFMSIWRKFLSLVFPTSVELKIHETLNDINGVVSLFIRGALLDALIVAILSSIGLSILGLEFAVFIGCFAGIANVIPYFGPILGMIPAFLVGAFTGGLSHGFFAVLILLVIQQIDANIIYPKVVGSTTGLHPLFVLLAVSIAGSFFGIVGMILAVPVAGIIQVFILKWVKKREANQLQSE